MKKGTLVVLLSFLTGFYAARALAAGQRDQSGRIIIHRIVNLVQLDVAVTDKKGNYITGLRPQNFAVYEDGIRERLATFGEANEAPQSVSAFSHSRRARPNAPGYLAAAAAGQSVFILFDTSNYMYRQFVFAQDAIAEFIRSLAPVDRVAFYSYSRDFSRGARLTGDRSVVLRGVRGTVAGDDAALYNCLLMTLEDSAEVTGRKVVVVFSNGPDNSSVVPPEDVLDIAQSEGIPIYMVSTRKAKLDPISSAVFDRVSAATGGKAYFAKDWEDQQKAFRSIRNDLAHLYDLSYYPQPNPNRGWRKITVRLAGVTYKHYHIRTRTGYRLTVIGSPERGDGLVLNDPQ
jgi:Ca-activated chloride channel family protein